MSQHPCKGDSPKANAKYVKSTSYISYGMTRREALKFAFGAAAAAVLYGIPRTASAASATKETTDALNNAQAKYNEVQSQLNAIASEYQALAEDLNKTMGDIESVQNDIDATQAEIEKKQEELEQKQSNLSSRVSESYKTGGNDTLSLLLSSTSFDELISNVYYLDKMNERDRATIAEVQEIQAELSAKKEELEKQKSDLEALKDEQTQKLNEMSAKKDEVQTILNGLDSDVKELMAKRDAELLASQQDEEAARKRAEEAKKAQQSSGSGSSGGPGSSGGSSSSGSGSGGTGGGGTGSASKVVYWAQHTPSPVSGLCAWWVADVFCNAGLGNVPGNACDMYANYCYSSNRSNLKTGMIIAVSSHPFTSAGAIYGHVGIYVGGGTVMDNIGYIRTCSADYWINFYGTVVTPRWGWAKGIVLS